MARYLRHQDEVKVEIDSDNDLVITQVCTMSGQEDVIIINYANIDWFIEILQNVKEDGYVEGNKNEMV